MADLTIEEEEIKEALKEDYWYQQFSERLAAAEAELKENTKHQQQCCVAFNKAKNATRKTRRKVYMLQRKMRHRRSIKFKELAQKAINQVKQKMGVRDRMAPLATKVSPKLVSQNRKHGTHTPQS